MSPSPLPPITSLLPSSTLLLPTLALLFEPAAAPHIHTLLLSHLIPHDSYHFATYPTLITHICSILLDHLTSPNNNNNNKAEEEDPEAYGRGKIIKEVINAHPRLGYGSGAAVVVGASSSSANTTTITISELSTKEQAHLLQPSSSSSARAGVRKEEEEERVLRGLNEEYENNFDGLRFVTFVNGRGREEVVVEMRRRIGRGNSVEEEMREAVRTVCDIAEDRVRKLGVGD